MEDQLAILHGLWGEPDGWSYDGVTGIQLEGALFRPRPVDVAGRPRTPVGGARPRIIVGGQGSPRSFRLAARYADEFNLSSSSPDKAMAVNRRPRRGVPGDRSGPGDAGSLDDGRRARRPGRATRSRRASGRCSRRSGRRTSRTARPGSTSVANRWVYGTPDEARAQLERFAAAGLERIMLQDFLPWDLDMIDVMGEELVGRA